MGLSRFDGERFKIYTSSEGLASSELTSPLQVSFSNFCLDSRGKPLVRIEPEGE